LETYAATDGAVGDQFPDERYVTAVIAQLDLEAGRLSWISAGHPPPLVIRDGRLSRTLIAPPAAPLGIPLDGPPPTVAEESLEPGDLLLLYTDGLTEARHPTGRCSSSCPASSSSGLPQGRRFETLRWLRHASAATGAAQG
jgi:serine phosphatase RsbU (regulator of sigma subunit)